MPPSLELVQIYQRHEWLILLAACSFTVVYPVKITIASANNQFLRQDGLRPTLVVAVERHQALG